MQPLLAMHLRDGPEQICFISRIHIPVGQLLTPQLLEKLRMESSATSTRAITPGMSRELNLVFGRLTVVLEANGAVVNADCG